MRARPQKCLPEGGGHERRAGDGGSGGQATAALATATAGSLAAAGALFISCQLFYVKAAGDLAAAGDGGGGGAGALAQPALGIVALVLLAIDETVILLHPHLTSVAVSIGISRGCGQNDSLAYG